MAASGDVTIAQDGGQGNVKAHPYLVALVRWCVSCLWSTATVLLHRLLAGYTVRPSITASKPPTKRAAGTDHLHPEPKVECQVLHAPAKHSLDVIFVHGLYGSLGNTWRQGDWRSKYKLEPNKVPLLRPSSCTCPNEGKKNIYNDEELKALNEGLNKALNEGKSKSSIYNDVNLNKALNEGLNKAIKEEIKKLNEGINEVTFENIDEKLYKGIKKIIPKDEVFITEKFFDHTVLDQVEILDNFETQAQFVRDLFENENRICDVNEMNVNEGKVEIDLNEVNCECKVNEGRRCEVGCGCVCDECYSSCWPRDWIREDYPEARVISVNYTSDPYLWRPLWIKECKRLRLHERAEQMTKQLVELGVGERPIIWVGHSKGGLFIKQIYCEAYEAHLKTRKDQNDSKRPQTNSENTSRDTVDHSSLFENSDNNFNDFNCDIRINNDKINVNDKAYVNDKMYVNDKIYVNDDNRNVNGDRESNIIFYDVSESNTLVKIDERNSEENEAMSSNHEEDHTRLRAQAGLWKQSAGFMFYSVPHRGSPLAGIKTPLTARSIELLEISKDCSLVLTLQDRWLKATEHSRPQVRSLVETCRTLMSVLWLRIVSVPSADAGIGALYGVSVDHREICKPSSRRCLLYEELMRLMHAALNQCRCDS